MNEQILSKYNTASFEKDLQELGISLNKRQMCQFLRYFELLVEWNEFMNLTAITDFSDVLKKHFVDSLSSAPYFTFDQGKSLIDVGTGAGFPGIPLKILFPELKVTLLDSLKKRLSFLDTVISELALSDIQTVHGRAEDFAKPGKFRESFDYCVSRAVANLSTLSEYCLPYVKTDGYFIAYKSEKAEEEMLQSKKALSMLGGTLRDSHTFLLPDSDLSRTILVIQKEKETPLRFPRKAGLPSKEPL